MYFRILGLIFIFIHCVKADLRSWALGFGKSSGGGVAIPAPNSANTSGKEYKTCWINGKNHHGKTHSSLKFAPECSTNGYWRIDYNTDWGTCIMFGDVSVSGCPFASSWSGKAEVISKNQGDKGGEWTDTKYGITFINCSKGSRVELHRSENTYCNSNPTNCKTLTSGSILSFLCPN